MSNPVPLTQRPWHCGWIPEEEEPATCLIGADGLFFARVLGRNREEAAELTTLMVNAPELAKALQELLEAPLSVEAQEKATKVLKRARRLD